VPLTASISLIAPAREGQIVQARLTFSEPTTTTLTGYLNVVTPKVAFGIYTTPDGLYQTTITTPTIEGYATYQLPVTIPVGTSTFDFVGRLYDDAKP
jgi:hypothetical protein